MNAPSIVLYSIQVPDFTTKAKQAQARSDEAKPLKQSTAAQPTQARHYTYIHLFADMELMSMPTEIHYSIHSFLDHPSLLSLSATNKYFRSLCPEAKVKESLLSLEKCSLVTETVLTKKSLLPCYICFKGRGSFDQFPVMKTDDNCTMASESASSRVCATCLVATRPELVNHLPGPPGKEWIFQSGYGPQTGDCVLYWSRYEPQHTWWLACPKCHQVKQYLGTPRGRRRRYDEAMLVGDMCAACYQPVWDQENAERRERKNARARQRYREKKEQARKMREAMEKSEQTVETGTPNAETLGMTGPALTLVPQIDLTMTNSAVWSSMFGFDVPMSRVLRSAPFDWM